MPLGGFPREAELEFTEAGCNRQRHERCARAEPGTRRLVLGSVGLGPKFTSEREPGRLYLSPSLQPVEPGSSTCDVAELTRATGLRHVELQHIELAEQIGANRVMAELELVAGEVDPTSKVGMVGKPPMTESPITLQLADTGLSATNQAIEVLERWLAMAAPVPNSRGLVSGGVVSDPAPAVTFAVGDVWSAQPPLGLLTVSAGFVELAGGAAGGVVLPAAGAAGEVGAVLAEADEVGAC